MYITQKSDLLNPLLMRGSMRRNNTMSKEDILSFRKEVAVTIGNRSINTNWGQFTRDLREGAKIKVNNPIEFLKTLNVLDKFEMKDKAILYFQRNNRVVAVIAYYIVDGVFYDALFNRLIDIDEVTIKIEPLKGIEDNEK